MQPRRLSGLVPGSSPGRPIPLKWRFTYENRQFIDSATRRTKTHENTIYLSKYSATSFSQVTPEILLKELFEPQAALLFTAFRHFAPQFVLDRRKFRLRVYDNGGRTNPMRESYECSRAERIANIARLTGLSGYKKPTKALFGKSCDLRQRQAM